MNAIVIAVLVAVYAVFATPSVAAPVRRTSSPSETIALQETLGDFELQEDKPVPKRNCKYILDEEHQNESGVYSLKLGTGQVDVLCDMTLQGGGWTVIMRRSDGSVNFNRLWEDYVSGFGSFGTEFFAGLDIIHALTKDDMELWVGLRSHETVLEPYRRASHVYKFARYGNFKVAGPEDGYMLTIGDYDTSSTAGDSLSSHSGKKFSTRDRDNDKISSRNCAEENKSGWWFSRNCHDSNLDGIWKLNGKDQNNPDAKDGIVWKSWKGDQYSLKNVIMAIRPVQQE